MSTEPNEDTPFAPVEPPAPPTMDEKQFAQHAEQLRLERARRTCKADQAEPHATSPFRFPKLTEAEEAEYERERQARIAERQADQRATALREWELAVPERLRHTEWSDPRCKPYQTQIDAVRGWKYGARGVFASGGSGRYKSRSIYALARRLAVDELVPVFYLLQTTITRDINREGLNAFLEKLDGIRRAPVIVWDDFGKFAAIGSRRELLVSELEALIDFRCSHGLPFLASTNAKDADLLEIFGSMRGEPILRRLAEGCQVVAFGWK